MSWLLSVIIFSIAIFSCNAFLVSRKFTASSTSLGLFKGLSGNKTKVDVNTLKESLLSESKNTKNGVTASSEQRETIAALIKQIEKANKVKNISSSRLSNGNWKLLYTTNDGSSAGKLGPFVGKVVQEIDVDNSFYVNNVVLGNGLVKASLTANWDVLKGNTWKVTFNDIALSLLGIPVTKKSFQATGTWRNTYLDENMRILYAIGGKNTVKENVYVLVKEN